MAVFCLSTLFVGCDQKCTPHADENADLTCDNCGEALEAPACKPHVDANKDYVCDNCPETFVKPCESDHKDENADKYCDACGLAIVTVNQIVEPTPEERVDMIVNPLPENGSIKDFISYEDYSTVISNAQLVEGYIVDINYKNYYAYIVIPQGNETDGYYNKYEVRNLITNNTLYSTDDVDKFVSIELNDFYFVAKESSDMWNSGDKSYKYIAYDNNKLLFDATANYQNLDFWNDIYSYEIGDVTYLVFDQTVYAYDTYTGELIRECDKMNLVHRPEFTYTTEKYGFVEMDNSVFVYDLSKWVECVYSYTIPSFYENAELFYINEERILLQASVELLDNAVSFDYIENGNKYDLVYMILDPVAKTETAVEFGYFIDEAEDWSDEDKTLNYVEAYPIVNDRIDYNNELTLITDKDLKITLNVKNDSFHFVTENNIIVYEEISEDLYVRKLVNAATGEFIAYVPQAAEIYSDYIYYDGVFYNFNMEVILDLEANDFMIPDPWAIHENYTLLTKVVANPTEDDPNGVIYESYYFSANGLTKIEIEGFVAFMHIGYEDYGFTVAHDEGFVDEYNNPILSYSFYNANNVKLFTTTSPVSHINDIGEGTCLIYTEDGTFYIAQ